MAQFEQLIALVFMSSNLVNHTLQAFEDGATFKTATWSEVFHVPEALLKGVASGMLGSGYYLRERLTQHTHRHMRA